MTATDHNIRFDHDLQERVAREIRRAWVPDIDLHEPWESSPHAHKDYLAAAAAALAVINEARPAKPPVGLAEALRERFDRWVASSVKHDWEAIAADVAARAWAYETDDDQ